MEKCSRLLLTMLLLLPLQVSAQITDSRFLQPSPVGDWYTLETDHFRINFKKENKGYAKRLAEIAERQHRKLIDSLRWHPSGKTEIVVNDKVDYSNGASTAYPYNQFFVYLNEPVEGTLKDHIDFAETLFTHEYTHILQMDQAKGLPAKLRRVFGKSPNALLVAFTMPQLLAPHWVSEGIAIYSESMSGFGRNNSTVFHAMMREEVATGLASFKEESYEGYYGSRWPFGQVYLYGAYFYQFLNQEYGQKAVTEYIDHYSDNLIPWKMNERARKTTGKSADLLWQEFQAYLEARFRPEIESRSRKGFTNGEVLFDKHWQNRLMTAGPNGSVFIYHKDRLHHPQIIQLMPNGERNTVLELKGVTSLKWHVDSGLLISQLGVCENSALYADLYRYEVDAKELTRITECARMPRADWAPDGRSVFAVQTSGAYNYLVQVALNGQITVLYKTLLGESIGFPAVSPDAKKIVVPVKRRNTGWNLESFDLQSAKWNALTQDSAIYSFPFFSAKNDSVCFVSDVTGTPELHCMDLNTGKQVVNTRSHGFINEAVVASNGVYWVSEYTADGDIIRKLEQTPIQAYGDVTSLIDSAKVLSLDEPKQSNLRLHSPTPYNALKTIRPRGWGPIFLGNGDSTALGVVVSGSDILGFHHWALSPMFFSQNEESHVGGVFAYRYNDRLSLLLSDVWSVAYEDDDGKRSDKPTVSEVTKNAQLLAHYPINQVDWSMDFYAGAAFETMDQQIIQRTLEEDTHNRVAGIGFSYNNLHRFAHAITESSGVKFQLQLESFDLLGGDTDHAGLATILKSRGYLRFGKNQTLSLKVDAGVADTNGKLFELGGSSDVVDSLTGISKLGQREFSLRGYSTRKSLTGTRFARASLAWHMPVLNLYNGFSGIPLGLGKVSNMFFVEAGDAWREGADKKVFSSIGVELDTEILIGYDSVLLPVVFGYASGLDKDVGENQFYLKLNIDY